MAARQISLPGMEQYSSHVAGPQFSAQRGRQARSERMGQNAAKVNYPAGMRGSVPDRIALKGRMERKDRNVDLIRGHEMRNRDEDNEEDTFEPHPTTGLPEGGPLSTHEDFGMAQRSTPHWASFHHSAPSARRLESKVKEVPIVSAHGENIGTPQWTVSSQRMHEALEDPSTRRSPRFFGRGMEELPHVFQGASGDLTLIDGNHRATSALASGQMIMQARVLTSENKRAVMDRTQRLSRQKMTAGHNPNAKSLSEQNKLIAQRYYGSDFDPGSVEDRGPLRQSWVQGIFDPGSSK